MEEVAGFALPAASPVDESVAIRSLEELHQRGAAFLPGLRELAVNEGAEVQGDTGGPELLRTLFRISQTRMARQAARKAS